MENGSPSNKRKLILHFDIRNTVLAADSVTSIKVEQALNSYLTGVTWGRETQPDSREYSEGWEWLSDTPSLRSPCPGAITYYKHLEHRVVVEPSDRTVLRRLTGDFTQRQFGSRFLPYFDKHLEYLKWPYKSDATVDPRLIMEGNNKKLYHYILPAFFKLIRHLHQQDRDFAVIFRTYGMDARNVLECTRLFLDGKHPGFPGKTDISLNPIPGKILRSDDADRPIVLQLDKSTAIQTEDAIFQHLSKLEGVSAFVDDFKYWQTNGYNHKAGKPLWFDPNHPTMHHIMFDDNIRTTDDDNIVNMRLLKVGGPNNNRDRTRSLDLNESAKFENICMVQADLLGITKDSDYYIKKVRMCERNLEEVIF